MDQLSRKQVHACLQKLVFRPLNITQEIVLTRVANWIEAYVMEREKIYSKNNQKQFVLNDSDLVGFLCLIILDSD